MIRAIIICVLSLNYLVGNTQKIAILNGNTNHTTHQIFYDSVKRTLIRGSYDGVLINNKFLKFENEELINDFRFGVLLTSDRNRGLIRQYNIDNYQLELINEIYFESPEVSATILNKNRILIQELDDGYLISMYLYDFNLNPIYNIPFNEEESIEVCDLLNSTNDAFYFGARIGYKKIKIFQLDSYTGNLMNSFIIDGIEYFNLHECENQIIISSYNQQLGLSSSLELIWNLNQNKCNNFLYNSQKNTILCDNSKEILFISFTGEILYKINLVEKNIIRENQSYHLIPINDNYIALMIIDEIYNAKNKQRIVLIDFNGNVIKESEPFITNTRVELIFNENSKWSIFTSNASFQISN